MPGVLNIRSYIIPLIAALLLHAGVLSLFVMHWAGVKVLPHQKEPPHIEAQMVDLDAFSPDTQDTQKAEQQAKKAQEAKQRELERQRRAEKQREVEAQKAAEKREQQKAAREAAAKKAAEQKAEAKRKAKAAAEAKAKAAEAEKARLAAAKAKKEKAAKEKAAREKAAREKAAREKAAREKAEKAKQEAAAKARREAEARAREQAQQKARRDKKKAADFSAYIKDLMQRYWHPPATSHAGMQATVSIRLFSTGEVDSVSIKSSSGDASFDRSVMQAIKRAAPYDKASTVSPIFFERYLRDITIVFKAEDSKW